MCNLLGVNVLPTWGFLPEHPAERDALRAGAVAEAESRAGEGVCHLLGRYGKRGVYLLHAGHHLGGGEEVGGFFGRGSGAEGVHQRIDIGLHVDGGCFFILLFHDFCQSGDWLNFCEGGDANLRRSAAGRAARACRRHTCRWRQRPGCVLLFRWRCRAVPGSVRA